MSNKTKDFSYFLPENLIAQTPIYPRDEARLLTANRESGEIGHKIFKELPDLLKEGDLLVINTTKVLPSRLFALDEKDRVFECLILNRLNSTDAKVLLKPARKAKIGAKLKVNEKLSFVVKDILEDGVRLVSFEYTGIFEEILNEVGIMPLPPYIKEKLNDKERYNTVYAKEAGSAAAPTAGLHFTNELIEKLKQKGVQFTEVNLNVGLGTFRPVKADTLEEHIMHKESYSVPEEAALAINKAKEEGRRVIAVGTTSVRTLESAAQGNRVVSGDGNTGIFIYPPYQFKIIDGMITNFHLPESTLIMLVSAFLGRKKTIDLYNLAVQNEYRFFSFGDAMLLL